MTHVQCLEAVGSPILARPGEVELFSSCSMTLHRSNGQDKLFASCHLGFDYDS